MPLLPDADPLLILAVVLVAGVVAGTATKKLRLPSITGQIVAGVLLGQAGFLVFDPQAVAGLHSVTQFALTLMAVTVGTHLHLRRLRNAIKRLSLLLLLEAIVTPAAVFLLLHFVGGIAWSSALLLGTLAISTAPATIVALVRETRSKGVFVNTLIAAVALNNMACIVLFELARAAARVDVGATTHGVGVILLEPALQLVKALALGGAAAFGMEIFTRVMARREPLATAAFVTVLLISGAAHYVDVSPLLAALFLGLIQANLTREREKIVDALFSDFWPAILTMFFTLAGMELTLHHARKVGVLALLFFLGRGAGKLIAAGLAMRLAGATERIRQNLGLALIPQAGVAIGLVISLQEDPAFRGTAMVSVFAGVVLTVVTANELLGPVTTRVALHRSGEAGRDRMRLIDFIQEENIVTDLTADTKETAIEKLVHLLARSHGMTSREEQQVLESVLEREAEVSTCFGGGLAVPHGILPHGKRMLGVMGLSREGLDIETPDGKPVRCMVLLATPDVERDRHLQVLAALARRIGSDPQTQARLFNAKSPAHAYEVLSDEESEDFNYFVVEPEEVLAAPSAKPRKVEKVRGSPG